MIISCFTSCCQQSTADDHRMSLIHLQHHLDHCHHSRHYLLKCFARNFFSAFNQRLIKQLLKLLITVSFFSEMSSSITKLSWKVDWNHLYNTSASTAARLILSLFNHILQWPLASRLNESTRYRMHERQFLRTALNILFVNFIHLTSKNVRYLVYCISWRFATYLMSLVRIAELWKKLHRLEAVL